MHLGATYSHCHRRRHYLPVCLPQFTFDGRAFLFSIETRVTTEAGKAPSLLTCLSARLNLSCHHGRNHLSSSSPFIASLLKLHLHHFVDDNALTSLSLPLTANPLRIDPVTDDSVPRLHPSLQASQGDNFSLTLPFFAGQLPLPFHQVNNDTDTHARSSTSTSSSSRALVITSPSRFPSPPTLSSLSPSSQSCRGQMRKHQGREHVRTGKNASRGLSTPRRRDQKESGTVIGPISTTSFANNCPYVRQIVFDA